MEDDIIEVRIYDGDHTKVFQQDARLKNKKQIQLLNQLLNQKGISINLKSKSSDYF